MLGLQNGLFLRAHTNRIPRLACLHLILQLGTLVTWTLTVLSDPGFIPGGEERDAELYWRALEQQPSKTAEGAQDAEGCSGESELECADGGTTSGVPPRLSAFCHRSEMLRVRRAKFSPYCAGDATPKRRPLQMQRADLGCPRRRQATDWSR